MFGTSLRCFSRRFLLSSFLYLLAVPSGGWSQTTGYAPADQAAFDTLVVGKRTDWEPANAIEWVSPGRFSQTIAGVAYSGSYTYRRTGPNAATTVFNYDVGLTCTTRSTFTTATSGRASYTCSDGQSAGPFDWRLTDPDNTERGDRRATLPNLSPWRAWVHLYCLKDRAGPDAAPCVVTFECNGQSGKPVTWPVEVAPKTIFSYWPNKTAPDGTAADLQATLIAAGKPEDEARRRTTCEVFSPDPLTVRGYTLFGGQPTLVPVAEPARPDVAAEPGERRRQATLPNLSPWQAWVHLYCLKDRGPDAAPCAVTFECNGQSGEPVTWPVEVAPKTIFSYWPNKTVDSLSADLQAALIAAGKPEDEARRRTTCEVSSADPIAVRGYTRFGGQPTLVPVTAY